MSKINFRGRQAARDHVKEKMLAWYISLMNAPPEMQCEDRKPYGKVLWWLEPLVPGRINPVLVEETLGDSWTLSVQALDRRKT